MYNTALRFGNKTVYVTKATCKEEPNLTAFYGVDGIEETSQVIIYKDGEKFGIYNKNTYYATKPVYPEVHLLKQNGEEQCYCIVKYDDKYRLYNFLEDTETRLEFDDFEPFVDGYGIVLIRGKWALVDWKGNIICSPKYNNIERIGNNFFSLDNNQVVSKKGGIIISDLPNKMGIYVSEDNKLYITEDVGGKCYRDWSVELFLIEDKILIKMENYLNPEDTSMHLVTLEGRTIPATRKELTELYSKWS